MFDVLSYRWNLRKLKRKIRELDISYSAPIAEAKKKNEGQDEIKNLLGEKDAEFQNIQHEIECYISQYLIRKAQKLMVPIPNLNNDEIWKYKKSRYIILSAKGMSELKSTIRQECRNRREPFIVLVSLLTGLIAAATGLVSILFK